MGPQTEGVVPQENFTHVLAPSLGPKQKSELLFLGAWGTKTWKAVGPKSSSVDK